MNYRIAICTVQAIICFTALLGNSAILTSSLHSSANVLLVCLAVSDLAVSLVSQSQFTGNVLSQKNYSGITCWDSGAPLKHSVFRDCNGYWCGLLASSSIAFEISSTNDSVLRSLGSRFYMDIFRYFWNHESLDFSGPM